MAAVLVLLLVVPIVEIYVLLQVGHAIGALATVGLLIAMSVLGAWLIKREGARAWRAFTSAAGSGRLPAREVADGALVLLGGALLLTPGFVSDVVGLLCILPPTRALLRRVLMSYITRRAAAGLGWAPAGMRVRSYR
ncbi:MAG: protein FxsA, partial [Frankiaceae bacterium]|nr:protein FxsA [Frankiaceae bacterium]